MRVLFIAGGDYKYGASKSMMSLILYLKDHYDVEPVLLTKQRNKLNVICEENGIESHSCWYCDFMSGSPYSFFPLKVAKHAVKYALYIAGSLLQKRVFSCGIDFDTIDIIHTNHNRIQVGAYISTKKKIPHVWHIREFGQEDYNVLFYRFRTISYMNSNADAFIAISNAVKDCWISKGLEKNKITTIYNGLEREKFIKRKKHDDNIVKIVICGHVQPNKGQLQIVKALTLLPEKIRDNVQLDIIGEGYRDYIVKINKVIAENDLKRVNFLGYCSNVPEKLAEYDVGVTCSKSEGFGRVTAEYILAGLYVIASDTGANPELIQGDTYGRLYKYGDIGCLAECIQEIFLHKDRYFVDKPQISAFSMNEYAGKVYQIYRQLRLK